LSGITEIVATIGHSTHSGPDFAALLHQHEVELLVDVRRHPGSRRVPQFNASALAGQLAEEGIDYLHLPELGGRRSPTPGSPNGGWRNDQFRGYADHMGSEEFATGLERLTALAGDRRAAVMCAEAQWWRCHRRLLSDALAVRGFEVVHVDARGGAEPHELTPFAQVEGERLTYPPAQSELEV
jgi:uncharacterized protein (DUF488 family)